jgi:hypothetical protein
MRNSLLLLRRYGFNSIFNNFLTDPIQKKLK